MTTLPAVVRVVDLPAATTISGSEIIMAVQTSGGVGSSVRLPLSQAVGTVVGALPASGGTGQVLQSLGTGFAASWVNLSALATASTGLAAVGSTTVAFALASTAGLSVLGVAAAASAVPAAIAGTAAQVLVVNDGGTGVGFGALNLGSAAAVTGVLPGANFSAVNLAASGAGGVQGVLQAANITTINLSTGVQSFLQGGSIATGAIGTTQLLTAHGLSVLAVASSGTSNFSLVTGAAGQLLAVNPAGTTIQFVGGLVLLNTLSPNNVATVGDTTSLTSTFRNYMVTFENVCPATQTTTLQMQIATTGAAFVSGGYVSMAQINVSSVLVTDTSTTVILLSGTRATTQLQTSTAYGVNGFIKLFNPASTAARKQIVGDVSYLTPGASATTTNAQALLAGYFDTNSNAVVGLQFAFNSGNIQTGTIKIYGLA
jgi:hypothetical protein